MDQPYFRHFLISAFVKIKHYYRIKTLKTSGNKNNSLKKLLFFKLKNSSFGRHFSLMCLYLSQMP